MKDKREVSIVRSSAAEYLTFVAFTGADESSIEMRYEDENIWLTQKMMSILYDIDVRTINDHIKKIYADGEQDEKATIRNFRIVQKEGSRQVSRDVKHYNLQMIIAVGFKVNNQRAVRFRIWANQIVEQYTIKGFAMDDERLKNGGTISTGILKTCLRAWLRENEGLAVRNKKRKESEADIRKTRISAEYKNRQQLVDDLRDVGSRAKALRL